MAKTKESLISRRRTVYTESLKIMIADLSVASTFGKGFSAHPLNRNEKEWMGQAQKNLIH